MGKGIYNIKKVSDEDIERRLKSSNASIDIPLILRTVCKPVKDHKDGRKIAVKLRRTLVKNPRGMGIAAPQCGIDARVFTYRPCVGGAYKIIINPKMITLSEEMLGGGEGCLSIPGVAGNVQRSTKITVEYIDSKDELVRETLENLEAVVFQHEYDHLEGVLYIDKASEIRKITP